jgi:NAD(P)-dependent dehydrogenase (short-subunit alcohol dehydrogenase family)
MVTDMITKGELDRAEAAAATPMARLGQADEIAASVLWLCSPAPASLSASPFPSTAATPPNSLKHPRPRADHKGV